MKKIFILSLVLFGFQSYAQVGIGTTAPGATLDIVAANPAGATTGVDGILIPRVTRQRAQSMTAVPTATIIYVNEVVTGTATGTAVNITAVGFYHYDGVSNTWKNLSTLGVVDADWYKTGTTATPTAITDDMFHTGNISVGKNTASVSKVDILETAAAKSKVVNVTYTIPSATNVEASLISTNTNVTVTPTNANPTNIIGLKNSLLGSASHASSPWVHTRTGVYNDLSSPNATGFYYGTYNKFDTTNGSGFLACSKTGVYNLFAGTGAPGCTGMESNFTTSSFGSSPLYGTKNTFSSAQGGAPAYGLYNDFKFTGAVGASYNASQYGVYNSLTNKESGSNYGVYTTINNTLTASSYGEYIDITSTGAGAGSKTGVAVVAGGTPGTTQPITGIYSSVPGTTATNNRYAARFFGNVSIGFAGGDDYYLPVSRGTNPLFGQIPITTSVNSGRETIWSPFSFQNTAATSVIAKYFGAFASATDWVNGATRVYTITDPDCRTSSSVTVSITNGTVAAADDFKIESVSVANGEFYVTVTNVSGADIAGGYSIPFSFTAFY
ncbi:hypothetical protein [Flavobacterium pedocola]